MEKRGLTVLTILLCLVPIAFAAHSATIISNYNSIYETNSANITLTVNNGMFSSASINNVNIAASGFNVNNIVNILGWTLTNNNSINFFTTTNAISNWGTQIFGFSIQATNVAQDTQNNWTITTTDTNLDSQINTLQFTILNDNTAPAITSTLPGSYNLGANELFSVNANDPETGILNSNLYISNCDLIYNNATNTSNEVYSTVILSCTNNVCSSTQDLTTWNEGDVCFRYDVSNRGGETATTNNLTTIIDRTPPSVTLTSPNDNVFLTLNSVNLDFNANDNYATQLACNVNVNGNSNLLNSTTTNNSFSLNVNDGAYTWFVACVDEVGLTQTTTSRTFTIDNSAPNITITNPSVVDRGNNAVINVSIVDLGSGVDQNSVVAEIIDTTGNITQINMNNNQITYSTTTSTIPGVYRVRITASDNLGQQSIQISQFRIRETFAITLSLSQNQIDASTPNLTRYVDLTGNILKDDSSIPFGTMDITKIMSNETLNIANLTGNFNTQIQIPQINGMYTIFASFTSGLDIFTRTVSVNVGPYCGNNVVDSGEACDGSTTAICSDYGFNHGTTSCSATCTIDTSLCYNPGNSGGNGGKSSSGSSGRSSSSGFIYTPPTIPIIEEPVVEIPQTSGIIEQISLEPETNEVSETETPTEQPLVGAAVAALGSYTKKTENKLLIAALLIGSLLYLVGWKREDDWDRYFRKYGHK